MAQPVFETLASLLLDVRPTALEGEAKEAWDDLIPKVRWAEMGGDGPRWAEMGLDDA